METFRQMVNHYIRIGLENNTATLKQLSKLCYHSLLKKYDVIPLLQTSCNIKGKGMLANRKQSIKRGYQTKAPYLKKGIHMSYYGFKIADGVLKVPLGNKQYFDIPPNNYVRGILSDSTLTVRTLFYAFRQRRRQNTVLSICYCKEIAEEADEEEIECTPR